MADQRPAYRAQAGAVVDQLAMWRRRRGITQQQLADQIHVERGTVSSWEAGTRKPSFGYLCAIIEALDLVVAFMPRKVETGSSQASDAYAVSANADSLKAVSFSGDRSRPPSPPAAPEPADAERPSR